MYGLAKESDLTFLLGRELIQVRVGQFIVDLAFDPELTVSLQCECQLLPQLPRWTEAFSLAAAASLLTLLGSKIIKVDNMGGGEIWVSFSNGSKLLIHDSNQNYESYQIIDPYHTIIV